TRSRSSSPARRKSRSCRAGTRRSSLTATSSFRRGGAPRGAKAGRGSSAPPPEGFPPPHPTNQTPPATLRPPPPPPPPGVLSHAIRDERYPPGIRARPPARARPGHLPGGVQPRAGRVPGRAESFPRRLGRGEAPVREGAGRNLEVKVIAQQVQVACLSAPVQGLDLSPRLRESIKCSHGDGGVPPCRIRDCVFLRCFARRCRSLPSRAVRTRRSRWPAPPAHGPARSARRARRPWASSSS